MEGCLQGGAAIALEDSLAELRKTIAEFRRIVILKMAEDKYPAVEVSMGAQWYNAGLKRVFDFDLKKVLEFGLEQGVDGKEFARRLLLDNTPKVHNIRDSIYKAYCGFDLSKVLQNVRRLWENGGSWAVITDPHFYDLYLRLGISGAVWKSAHVDPQPILAAFSLTESFTGAGRKFKHGRSPSSLESYAHTRQPFFAEEVAELEPAQLHAILSRLLHDSVMAMWRDPVGHALLEEHAVRPLECVL